MVAREAVRAFLADAAVMRGHAEGTVFNRRLHLLALTEWIERTKNVREVQDVTPAHLSEFLQARFDHKAASTLNGAVSTYRRFFAFCSDRAWIENNPADGLVMAKSERPLPNVLSVEEMRRLVETPNSDSPTDLRDRALVEFGYATGARASEWARVRPSDFEPGFRGVRLFGKGRQERAVPVGRFARVAIGRYVKLGRPVLWNEERSNDQLFLGNQGHPLTARTLALYLADIVRRSGIEKPVTPHTIRHSCATHLLIGGAGLDVVQAVLGHADICTTQIYTHLDGRYLRQVHRLAYA